MLGAPLFKKAKIAVMCGCLFILPATSTMASRADSPVNQLIAVGQPTDAQEFALGRECARNRQFTSAVKHFNKAVSASPDSLRYRYERGVANLQLKDGEQALGDFEFCRQKNPRFVIASKLWAAAYRASGKFKEAEEEWTKALADEPRRLLADIYYGRAQTFLEDEKYASAVADYDSAIALRPEGRFYVEQAQTYEVLKNYDKALQDYKMAAQIEPGNTGIFLHRAICYLELGKYKECLEDYARAMEAKPRTAKLYAMRARAYDKMGRHDLADKDRQTARDLGEEFSL